MNEPVEKHSLAAEIEAIFSPRPSITVSAIADFAAAFKNLAGYYAHVKGIPVSSLRFNEFGIVELLYRFQRDAYGVRKYKNLISSLHAKKQIDDNAFVDLDAILKDLGIRVNTHDPRKTRIAACFALWMATFRPVYVDFDPKTTLPLKTKARPFTAALTLFICWRFLRKHGTVRFGTDPEDDKTRKKHVLHDLMYRHITHSTLELLFCSVFRPYPKPPPASAGA